MANNNEVQYEKIVIEDNNLGFQINQIQENIDKVIRPLNLAIAAIDIEEIETAIAEANTAIADIGILTATLNTAVTTIATFTSTIATLTTQVNTATAAVSTLTVRVVAIETSVIGFNDRILANDDHRATVSGNPHMVTKANLGLDAYPIIVGTSGQYLLSNGTSWVATEAPIARIVGFRKTNNGTELEMFTPDNGVDVDIDALIDDGWTLLNDHTTDAYTLPSDFRLTRTGA